MSSHPTNARKSKLYDHTPDASLPERVTRSTHDVLMQMKLVQPNMPAIRTTPVPAQINIGRLTEYEMFDMLEHFFSTQKGHDIEIQWMLLDMQGVIPGGRLDANMKSTAFRSML